MESALAYIENVSAHQENILVKRRGGEAERVFGGVTGFQYSSAADAEQYRAQTSYDHYRGEAYAAIRPIAQRIAGQPIHVAEVVNASRNEIGEKAYAPPKMGRRRLALEEMAALPKWLRKRLRLPTCSDRGEFVKMVKAMHSEAVRVDILESHPVLEAISSPNPRFWQHNLIEVSVVSLKTTGKCYWWLTKSKRRKGFDIWHLPTSWVREQPNNIYLDQDYLVSPIGDPGGDQKIPAERMVYFYYPNPANPVAAYAPMRSVIQAVQVDEAIQQAQHQTFLNGLFPYLAFIMGDMVDPAGNNIGKPQLERWQLNELDARLSHLFRGPQKHAKHIVLDRTISDVKFISNKPHEMDWTQSGEYNRDKIWRGIGTPRVIAGDIQDANRATALVADEAFCGNVINPDITLISCVINDRVLPLYNPQNEDLILWIEEAGSSDRDARRKDLELLLNKRGLMVDELRAECGFPALPDGLGKVIVSAAMDVYESIDGEGEQGVADREELLADRNAPGGPESGAEGEDVIDMESEDGKSFVPVEKDYDAAWLKLHGKQERLLKADVKKFLDKQVASIIAKVMSGESDVFDPREWDAPLKRMVRPHLLRDAATGAHNMLRAMKAQFPEQIKADDDVLLTLPPNVVRAIRAFLDDTLSRPYWQGINDTTNDLLRAALDESIINGESVQQQTTRIREALGMNAGDARSLLIARTTTTGGLNSGQRFVLDDLKEQGLSEGAQWLAVKDEATRDSHFAADGQKTDAEGYFTIGAGHRCRFPGDPDLPPEETCNCRCSLLSAEFQRAVQAHQKFRVVASTILKGYNEHIERRFLVDDLEPIRQQLEAHGDTRDYSVTSVYLDHQTPTWSMGAEQKKKYRLRRYDSGDTFLESKYHINGVSHKKRKRVSPEDGIPDDLIPVGIVSYTRTEYDRKGYRITLDRDVKFNGMSFGKFIVEVKGDMPKWLELPENSESESFSKSSAMLGMWS